MRLLIKNVFTPLSILYFVILYLYTLQILVIAKWPQGKVGWLVSGLSLMATLTFLIKRPFEKQERLSGWIEKFWSLSFALLIPLLLLLCGAIWRRVQEYGWTEDRIALALLTLWMLGVAIYYFRPEKRTLHAIPISLMVVCLAFWLGPTSLQTLALHSQKSELRKILGTGSLNGFKFWEQPTGKNRERLFRVLTYICREHGLRELGQSFGYESQFAEFLTKDAIAQGRQNCYGTNPNDPLGKLGKLIGLKDALDVEPTVGDIFDFGNTDQTWPTIDDHGTFVTRITGVQIYSYVPSSKKGFQFWWKNHRSNILMWSFNDSPPTEIDMKKVVEKLRELQKSNIPFQDSKNNFEQVTKSGKLRLVFNRIRLSYTETTFDTSSFEFFAFFTPARIQ